MEPHCSTTMNPTDRKINDHYAHKDASQFQQTSPMLYRPDQHDNPRPDVLLILVPGALLQPSDYDMLCACICDTFKHSPVALWLCVCSMSWRIDPTSVQDQFDGALESALETAVAEGFKPLAPHPGGRNENVFVAMHSVAIMAATGFPLKKSAGIVALGSTLFPSESINMDAYTFPRPLMHIWGERDGQMNLFKAYLVAGRALARDLPLGITAVSSLRPMLVVPGMNHAQFSNGIIRKERGDFEPVIPQDEAVSLVSKGMLHFLTVNCAHMGIPAINVSTAVQVLTSMTEEAARFIDVPAVALGRASPIRLLQLSKIEDDQGKLSGGVGEEETMLLALACGAEAYPKSSKLLQQLAHPGEEKAAREFAINAQLQVFRKVMAPEVAENIRIAATVHHLKETFLRSQAEVIERPKGWGVHVHILLWREGLTSSYSPLTFVSPTYALKLKQGDQLLKVIGVKPARCEEDEQHPFSATKASSNLFETALAMVSERARNAYLAEGLRLDFVEERLDIPMNWAEKEIYFDQDVKSKRSSSERVVSVYLPCIYSPTSDHPLSSDSRFYGAFYYKCPSLAWMVEWILGGFAKFK